MTFVHGPEGVPFLEDKPAKLRFFLGYVDNLAPRKEDDAEPVSFDFAITRSGMYLLVVQCYYLMTVTSNCSEIVQISGLQKARSATGEVTLGITLPTFPDQWCGTFT